MLFMPASFTFEFQGSKTTIDLFDLPWYSYAALAIAAVLAAITPMVMTRMLRNSKNVENVAGWWFKWKMFRLIMVPVVLVVGYLIINDVLSKIKTGPESGSDPIVGVMPEEDLITARIPFCVPDIKERGFGDLGDWVPDVPFVNQFAGPPSVKFDALGEKTVGIRDFDKYARAYWQAKAVEQQIREGYTRPVLRITLKLPPPEIFPEKPDLYFDHEGNLSDEEGRAEYGGSWDMCGGTSHFHSQSGGGLTSRLTNIFTDGDTDMVNDVVEKAKNKADELIRDPDADYFDGMSAEEKAYRVSRSKVINHVSSLQGPALAELKKRTGKDYTVLVIPEFVEGLELPVEEVAQQLN